MPQHGAPISGTSPAAGLTFALRLRRALARWAAHPRLLRPLCRLLRRFKPVLEFRGQVLVTRHRDVVEVLTRDQDFTIAEINAARMNRVSGPFILSMDRSAEYDREATAIRAVVEPGDLEWIHNIVSSAAADLIVEARQHGQIDVVGAYTRLVAARVVTQYFGVAGPTEHTQMRWMRAIFWDVFLNRNDDPLVRRASDAAVADLRACLTALIARKRQSVTRENDLLARLLRAGSLDDESVCRNITGIVVGAVDTTTTAVAQAVDVLLRKPKALQATRKAALDGDRDTLARCCYEALRFHPQTPALLRHCARRATLSSGATIPPGRQVVALTLSAMFDPQAFVQPSTFLANRDLNAYLHFGHGMHTCYGRLMNGVQIPELIGQLVALPDLRRAPGRYGFIRYEGPFPDRFVLAFRSSS